VRAGITAMSINVPHPNFAFLMLAIDEAAEQAAEE